MNILHREDLQRGGFAGLRETRMVMDPRVFGNHVESGAWPGIGNFVYLADAVFAPHGQTNLHPHHEIDVISVMVEGRISHEGSMEHGQELAVNDVQAQRAGGEGFSHNEINPDDVENRMIQIWVMPETLGEPAGYKVYKPQVGQLNRIYGGPKEQNDTLDSHTLIDVGLFTELQEFSHVGDSLMYLSRGAGLANGATVKEGDMVSSEMLNFTAVEEAQVILIHTAKQ